MATWADVPVGEQLAALAMKDQWEQDTGYKFIVPDWALANIASYGVSTLKDFGDFMTNQVAPFVTGNTNLAALQPWAGVGLSKDSYQSLATTFGSEYKKVTGQDIPADQLAKAFTSSQTGAGGLLTGSEYAQQLTSDKAIQDTFGWVKYGLDYNQFQQQKLGMQQAFGQPLEDHQAVAQLQYWHANAGSDRSVHAQTQQAGQKQTTPGEGQSEVR